MDLNEAVWIQMRHQAAVEADAYLVQMALEQMDEECDCEECVPIVEQAS